jgi:plastocyanin
VATDGNAVPEAAQITKDTIMIAPGERYDLLLVADNPGVWMVHCHIENHADNGMMTLIQYEGVMPSGPLAEGWDPATGGLAVPSKDPSMGASHMGHGDPAVAGTPEIEVIETETANAPEGEELSGDATIGLVDNRFVPNHVTVTAGTTVTFTNNGGNWHSVLGGGGSIKSGPLESGESFAYTFDAPGTYKVVCTQHLRQGMNAEITVVESLEG